MREMCWRSWNDRHFLDVGSVPNSLTTEDAGEQRARRESEGSGERLRAAELLLFDPVAVQNFLGVVILHLGRVPQNFIISGFQQLLAPVMELRADGLLHPRVGELALSRRLFRDEFHD